MPTNISHLDADNLYTIHEVVYHFHVSHAKEIL